jgi:hypothetical protein
LIDLSEGAFRLIAEALLDSQLSLQDLLEDSVLKVKLLLGTGKVVIDAKAASERPKYVEYQAVPVEKLFEKLISEVGVMLSEEQMGSVIFVAGRQIQLGKERVSAFLVKDILKILEAYGFKETSKMASKEVIDAESLKILSKLSDLIR